jgi:hypothetical protein
MLIDTHVERHAAFAKHGFQFARGLVDSEDLLRALNSVAIDVRSGRPSDGNGGARGAHCIHSSEAGNYLFEKLTPKIVELVGSSVVPRYSYVRVYKEGGILPLHVDRPGCEVTVTITLDYDAKALWPIFLLTEKVISATLDKGDALLFDATKFLHCRRAFEGQSWTQATLHYVIGQASDAVN